MQVELGRLYGSGESQRFDILVERLCRVTIWAAVAMSALLLAGGPLFIPLWTNGRIAFDWPLLTILTIGACIGSLADAILIALVSINQVGRAAIAHLAAVGVGLLLGGLLVNQFGPVMIAAGLVLPEVVVVLIGRSELSRHMKSTDAIRFGEMMRWPGDLLWTEFQAVKRRFS
jgi:O-antigen/teichoic acid export membrane protein